MKKTSKKSKITIDITEEHMYAIEDIFFCDMTKKEYEDMRPLLLEIWERICWSIDETK